MEILQNNITTLPEGTLIELKGKDLATIRWVKDVVPADDAPNRADGSPARGYTHFAIGGRGFTIDDQSADDIAMLKDKVARKQVASVMLTATVYKAAVLDEDRNPTDEFIERNAFRFEALITNEDAKAYAKSAGEVAQVEAQYAPKPAAQQAVTDERLGKLIGNQLTALLPGLLQAHIPAPVVAPVAEAVNG